MVTQSFTLVVLPGALIAVPYVVFAGVAMPFDSRDHGRTSG